jgi:hypothetical protein
MKLKHVAVILGFETNVFLGLVIHNDGSCVGGI